MSTSSAPEKEALVLGVNAVFIGVKDAAQHIDLYCGHLGYETTESGLIDAETACAIWGEGLDDIAVTVLTAAGSPHGRIVLLSVADAPSAGYPHTADLGVLGINMYTRDILTSHQVLTSAGYSWESPPATWEVPFGESVVSVTEGICRAPDGTPLVFVQPADPRATQAWKVDPERQYTEVTSVVSHVPDLDQEVAFWGPEGMGLDIWYDVSFSSRGLEEMTGLPAGTELRLALLAGSETARIEITHIQDTATGVDRRLDQRIGHSLGHSGWLVRTYDLDAALTRVVECGGSISSGPLAAPNVLFGAGRVALVETPNGTAVTLHEPA